MGLVDKWREQAAQVAQRTAQVTQDAAQQGRARLDQAQAKRLLYQRQPLRNILPVPARPILLFQRDQLSMDHARLAP